MLQRAEPNKHPKRLTKQETFPEHIIREFFWPGLADIIAFCTGKLIPPSLVTLLLRRSQKEPSMEPVHSVQKYWSSL